MIDVIIEISKGSNIKYEYDGPNLKVDRFLNVPFVYPFNYGYLPQTMGRDADPLDAVVLCEPALLPGCRINCKLIGVLKTEDEHGEDNKFIFVPCNSVDIKSKSIHDLNDIPKKQLDKVEYFFTHYKDLDENKWIKINGWCNDVSDSKILLKHSNIYEKTLEAI